MATLTRPWEDVEIPASTRAGGPRHAARGSGSHWVLTPALLFVATVAAHLAFATRMRAPIIHTDELAYLDIARWLAHGGLPPRLEYYPGYSLALAPLAWVFRSPLSLYRAALALNAALAGLTTLGVWALVPRLAPDLSRRTRTLVTVAVALYPMFLLGSDLAMSENLFIPGFVGLVLAVSWAAGRGGAARWAAVGAAGGALALVHPRGLAVGVALLLVGVMTLRPWGRLRGLVGTAALFAGVAATAVPGRLLIGVVGRGATANAYRVSDILGRFGSLGHLGNEVAGHALYAVAATFGLAVLGMGAASVAGWRLLRGADSATSAAAAFCGIGFVAVLLLSSLFLTNATRLDHFIYGRYDEGVLAPLLVLGLVCAVHLRDRARVWAILGWIAAVAVVAGGTAEVVWAAHRGHATGSLVRPNVMGVDVVLVMTHFRLNAVALAAWGAGGALLALVAFRRRTWAGVLVLIAGFAPSAATASLDMAHGSAARAGQRVVADALDAIHDRFGGATGCLADDLATFSLWHAANDRLFHPLVELSGFDSRRSERPCSELVVSGRTDLASVYPGARMVVPENNGPGYSQALWVLPGELATRLDAAGWLLPPATPGALPAGARRVQLAVAGEGSPLRMRADGRADLEVTVRHAGGASPWPNAAGLGGDTGAVEVVATWSPAPVPGLPPSPAPPAASAPPVPVATAIAELPRSLLPGEQVRTRVRLVARAADGHALTPGRYLVHLEVVQEGQPGTFALVDGHPADRLVEVSPGG
ncbi:MAG: hypothetical protein ACYDAD_08910 [Acidimicrobiales bacterium]